MIHNITLSTSGIIMNNRCRGSPSNAPTSKEPEQIDTRIARACTRIHTIKPNRVYESVFPKGREKEVFWPIDPEQGHSGSICPKKKREKDLVLQTMYSTVSIFFNKRRPQCPCIALRSGLNPWMFILCLFQILWPVSTRLLRAKITFVSVFLPYFSTKYIALWCQLVFVSPTGHFTSPARVSFVVWDSCHPRRLFPVLIVACVSLRSLSSLQPHRWTILSTNNVVCVQLYPQLLRGNYCPWWFSWWSLPFLVVAFWNMCVNVWIYQYTGVSIYQCIGAWIPAPQCITRCGHKPHLWPPWKL